MVLMTKILKLPYPAVPKKVAIMRGYLIFLINTSYVTKR